MGTPKEYRVVGTHTVLGHKPGDVFTYVLASEFETYLINAGHLAYSDSWKPEPLTCEHCKAHGTKKEAAATHTDLSALQQHYREEHPGLVPPSE